MRVLRDFLNSFDFVRMKPDNSVVKGGVPSGYTARALAAPSRACAIYLRPADWKQARRVEGLGLEIELPAGKWHAEWISPLTGELLASRDWKHAGGAYRLWGPTFDADVALRIRRQ